MYSIFKQSLGRSVSVDSVFYLPIRLSFRQCWRNQLHYPCRMYMNGSVVVWMVKANERNKWKENDSNGPQLHDYQLSLNVFIKLKRCDLEFVNAHWYILVYYVFYNSLCQSLCLSVRQSLNQQQRPSQVRKKINKEMDKIWPWHDFRPICCIYYCFKKKHTLTKLTTGLYLTIALCRCTSGLIDVAPSIPVWMCDSTFIPQYVSDWRTELAITHPLSWRRDLAKKNKNKM